VIKVIVTGGCGFIGSHVVEQLLASGYHATVLDNMSTGRRENINFLTPNSNLTIIEADVRDLSSMETLFQGKDYVFHLAALADIVPSIEEPEEYYTTNVTGTFNALQAALKANVKKFIYAASSSCYGIPDNYPTKETAEIRPQYPYALTKYLGEELVKHWNQVYRLPTVSLRLSNVFGPRSRTSGTYGAVFGVFLAQKLAKKPLTVVGDGSQTRDFTYVKDVANAFIKSAESKVSGEIMNVGSGNTYSINTLVSLLGGEKVHIPKRPGEPSCTFADIDKINELIGWRPTYSFEQGVTNVVENIEYWREAPVWEASAIQKETESWFKYLTPEEELHKC
jgi:UDP-glucose 4-epimerase